MNYLAIVGVIVYLIIMIIVLISTGFDSTKLDKFFIEKTKTNPIPYITTPVIIILLERLGIDNPIDRFISRIESVWGTPGLMILMFPFGCLLLLRAMILIILFPIILIVLLAIYYPIARFYYVKYVQPKDILTFLANSGD